MTKPGSRVFYSSAAYSGLMRYWIDSMISLWFDLRAADHFHHAAQN